MGTKNTNLRQFDLYLSKEVDARLIEHLEKFTRSHRTNEELRRMLYMALDGVITRAAAPAPRPAPSSTSEANLNVNLPTAAADSKAKMRRTFGGFED